MAKLKKGMTHKSRILQIEREGQRLEIETRISEARSKLDRAKNERERLGWRMKLAKAEADLARLDAKERARTKAAAARRRDARGVTGIGPVDSLIRSLGM